MDPIFTPFLVSLLAPAIGAEIAGFVAPLLTGVLLAAGSILLNSLLAKPPPKPGDGRIQIQETVPYKTFGYGTARVSPTIHLHEVDPNGSLALGGIMAAHRVKEFQRYYLNDDEVTIQGDGTVNALTDGAYGHGQIHIFTRLGVDPETAESFLVSRLSPTWTNDHRGDGLAQMYVYCSATGPDRFGKIYKNGKPQFSAALDLAFVFDPRSTDQLSTDPETWEWSKNPVLGILHYLCFSEFGPQRSYALAVEPVIEQWIEEADICDELFDLKHGGTIKRYEMGGWSTTSTLPRDLLKLMLATCDGWLCERGDGCVLIRVGKFRPELAVAIDEAFIEGFQVQDDLADEDETNHLNVTFSSPDHHYSTQATDPFDDIALQTQRGYVRESALALDWVQHNAQARRLGKREFFRNTNRLRGEIDVRLSRLNAAYERWAYITSPSGALPRLNAQYIEQRGTQLSLTDLSFKMTFIGIDATIEDWTAATDEGEAPAVPEPPVSAGPPQPVDPAAEAHLFDVGGGVTGVRLLVSCQDTVRTDLTYVVRWRDASLVSGDPPGDWHTDNHSEDPIIPSTGRIAFFTGAVDGDTLLDVEIASRAPKGTLSDWSETVQITAIIDTTPPGDVTAFTVIDNGDGTADVSFTTADSAHFKSYAIYRADAVSGVVFADASVVVPDTETARNRSITYTDASIPGPGDYDYWILSKNPSAVETITGPVTVTIA